MNTIPTSSDCRSLPGHSTRQQPLSYHHLFSNGNLMGLGDELRETMCDRYRLGALADKLDSHPERIMASAQEEVFQFS